ncbi:hypothetical protein [Spiroplasma chrysopicola]|uniref:Uncharacterized protein n=1 Tax=Spiroplasma chrysopicola DF-1 TaxID=1276227 RepID=R4UGF1_9MOLU|nr:hypothetical protein [Spiroplasma chrysopicola]AGM25190.1 hypothetical protein SCHRY_v1c06120 [Spiroplasma chrysopicola DF-1]
MERNSIQIICNQIENFAFEDLFIILTKIEEVVKERTVMYD